jgi:WD40 repeat protein
MKDGVLKTKHNLVWRSLALLIFASALCCAQKATSSSNPPELVVQTGHSGKVSSLAFSPDGKTLASSSGDKTIKFWNFATGEQLRTIEGAGGLLAFGPNGKIIVAGDIVGLAVWDVSSGAKLRDLNFSVTAVALSPNGRIIAGNNFLWDTSTGARLRMLDPTAHFDSAAFSPDGKLLASGAWEGTVKLWDVSTGAELRSIETGIAHVLCVAFSPNGKLLAGAGMRGPIKLWDVSTGAELRSIESGSGSVTSINSVAFSPDGKILASGGRENGVKLWDVSTGVGLAALNGHFGPVAFSPDGRILASGSADSTIKLWDLTTRSDVGALKGHSEFVRSAAFSNDGKTLAAGSGDGTVRLWDVSTGGLRTLKGHSGAVWSVAFSPEGKVLASGSLDGTVKLWDVSTARELRSLNPGHDRPDGVQLVVFSPDGKTLASGSMYSSTLKLWDVEKGAELQTLMGFGSSIAFSPDSQTLAFGDGGTVRLRNISTRTDLLPLKIHPEGGLVELLAFSPDGKTLATASIGRGDVKSTVKLWDFSSGRELRTLKGLGAPIAFSSDGRMLAGGSWNGILALSDVQSGIELRTFTGGHASVNSIAFSPNNKYLVSGNSDSTLKIWDVGSGKELAALIALDQNDWLVVTPDGLFDGTSTAWNKILWRFNNHTFDHAPVEAFFGDFYYPGLLTDVFAGKQPKAASDISQKDRRQPQLKLALPDPLSNATLTTRNVAVRIDVAELAADKDHKTGSGVQDVRLFRNGALVKVWRGDVLKGQAGVMLEATIPIVAGANNFTAYAFNHDNIKSSDASLTVKGADSLKSKGTLHILTVGVSQYANREYNLDYTTDDATSFATQLKLEQAKQTQYQSVEIKTLLNQNATKANILAELKELAASVQPEDGVVVYFSGHGKASGDHFYLVPYDLGYTGSRDQLSDQGLQQILKHSISDLELEEAFRGIDAGQMFMIIDACNSGQALENKDEPRRGPMNTRGLAQLAYEKGMYIMTASQNVEEAFVSAKLKHSYLTYALVEEGLKTKAADADHNGEVNLREWFDYALARVPKLREETLQSKSLEEVTPKLKAARSQKSQTPRVFYRREPELHPLIVARP